VLLEAGKEYQKQYRLSSWWIEHRDGLKRLGLILFACVDGIFLLVAGWAFVDAYAVSYADEQRSVLEIVAYGQSDLRAYSVATAAEDLDLGGTTVVASSEGKYDLYATIADYLGVSPPAPRGRRGQRRPQRRRRPARSCRSSHTENP